ncbi:POP1-domain-containing protein [Heliocybe sulcata]|uniref:POP1-domain-containing protein n=1 Tax=Heliocybe sulcata TaxID=5364 RepID=A0A5C3N633_9AGAM|nr:POP1-domain-containing protein [Heliocybe sulcata]
MPPKRPNEDEVTATQRKRQKMDAARTIAVQPVSGSSRENAVAGSSRVTFAKSMAGLPSTIDVERFAEARAFEINAMEQSMKDIKEAKTTRVWQGLPRQLRRRAASHDVRRVPARLREKARAEMDTARRKALGRSKPKRGKEKRITRTESFLRRQRDKTWLETHIWHAKRMHMENSWGYRLAVRPTEKSFRPSHRASVHGAILHDASYFGLIEIQAQEDDIKALLDRFCDPQGPSPGSKRYTTGARVLETHAYEPGTFPYDLLGPVMVMWRPPISNAANTRTTDASDIDPIQGRGKGKGKAKTQEPTQTGPLLRTAWVRCHPSIFENVHSALISSASSVLDAHKKAGSNDREIRIHDLREHVNVFEIIGPKSSQVIKGALRPVNEDKRDEFKKFWTSLTDLQSAGSVPRGMAIGFKVYDPRLSFPPKNAKIRVDKDGLPSLSNATMTFPTSVLAQSEIWEENVRHALRKPKYKTKDIDERKSKNLVPGTSLSPERQDDRIPVLLIQRSLEKPPLIAESSSSSSLRLDDSFDSGLHGWTLIIPSGWAMAFWMSLTHSGTRVAGQRERQTQAFEAGVAYFPRDFPFTSSYERQTDAAAAREKEEWERKPPAKRINHDALGTRSPWKPDWSVVLGLQAAPAPAVDADMSDDLVPTQREQPAATNTDAKPWLLCGPEVLNIVNRAFSMLNPSAGFLEEVKRLRMKRNLNPIWNGVTADVLWKGALIRIRVTIVGRGSPEDRAMIYPAEDAELKEWIKMRTTKQGWAGDIDIGGEETQLGHTVPPSDAIIGYVTTGHYSLSRGQGFAIGAMPLTRVQELKQQTDRLRLGSSLYAKVRDRGDTVCRLIRVEILGS